MKKEKGSWKNVAKSFAFLVGFVFVLNAVDFTFELWLNFLGGTLRGNSEYYKLAFYYGIVFFGVGFFGVHYYGWFHKFTARVVGVPIVEKHAEKLIEENNKLQEQILDLTAANISLNETNDRLMSENKTLLADYQVLYKAHFENVPAQHFDDWALDQFVAQMRATLARKREDDFGGWNDTANPEDLRLQMLLQANKGEGYFNAVHVANYAMMVWVRDAFPEECKTSNPDA